MKITITPDYSRHTEFTPAMRIVLAELAEKRILYVTRFTFAKFQYDAILEGDDQEYPIKEADALYKKMQDILEVIGEIDQAIREIYFLHGRLN